MRKLKSLFQPIFKIFLSEKSSIQFSIGIIVGMAFSIAVILCTVGIMDGFVDTLKGNLRKATGDIVAYSSEGFFNYKDEIEPLLNEMKDEHNHPVDVTALIQTEGFIVSDNLSKGIVLKGIDPESFKKVTGIDAKVTGKEILLGKELAEELNPAVDDQVVIALADGNRELSGMPALNSFIYKGIVDHKIYEKNVRFAYVHNKYLKELLELPLLDNTLLFSLKNPPAKKEEGRKLSAIDDTIIYLLDKLGPIFQVRSYWQEYTPLLEAVRIEKFMIGLILQLIVVISMFNVLAFIIFINEKKVQEVFLLQALGMSRKELLRYMVALTVFLWGFACVLSIGFVYFFDYLLQVLPIFQLPGKIYTLKIELGIGQYIFVFLISAIWLFVINVFGLARFRKKSILSGLRKEFA